MGLEPPVHLAGVMFVPVPFRLELGEGGDDLVEGVYCWRVDGGGYTVTGRSASGEQVVFEASPAMHHHEAVVRWLAKRDRMSL